MAQTLELAIPSTTISHDSATSKPFTLYNITLRLPLRTFVIQKRYSEFVKLDSELIATTSSSPPVPLPGKSWLNSTVSSVKLTETRREGLEKYMRAIINESDRRWQETSAWRNFLNLPNKAGGSGAKYRLVSELQRGSQTGQLTAEPSVWLDVHREMKSQLHEARLFLGQRDSATTFQAQHIAGANAKKCLVRVGSLMSNLEEGLEIMREAAQKNREYVIGAGELRRRNDLLGSAKAEREGLEKLALSLAIKSQSISGENEEFGARQKTLFGANTTRLSGRVLGAPVPETQHTRELENKGLLQLQEQMMQSQDQDVEELAKIVSRQKEMSLTIYNELELQNEMLKKVEEGVDRVGMKIDIAKKRANKIR